MALLVPNCPSSRRFFRVRFDRLTPREQDYPSHGETAFTVTMFDRYMVPHKRGARLPACISGRGGTPPFEQELSRARGLLATRDAGGVGSGASTIGHCSRYLPN